MMPETLLAIALGGAIGGAARHALSEAVQKRVRGNFPWGTLCVNVSGSLAIGMLAGFIGITTADTPTEPAQLMLITSVLGSFTTVSAFSLQTLMLYRSGHQLQAALNVLASTLLCLTGAGLGMRIMA